MRIPDEAAEADRAGDRGSDVVPDVDGPDAEQSTPNRHSITVEEIIGTIQSLAAVMRDQEARAKAVVQEGGSHFWSEVGIQAAMKAQIYEELLEKINQ